MKIILSVLTLGFFQLAALSAADVKTYQVTGPILEVTDSMIAVQKGTDRWEIARDASSQVTGDLKVGSKVTITYTMTAKSVEVKPANGAAKAAAAGAPAAVDSATSGKKK